MTLARVKARCRFLAGLAAFSWTTLVACSSETGVQPITYGAKPWVPPAGWDPVNCATGNYVAIDSCPDCTAISYALCIGNSFTQCVCGGPVWPGATCPLGLVCASNDFPPENWTEYTDYDGPGHYTAPDAGSGD
jgi:hypothetical protein